MSIRYKIIIPIIMAFLLFAGILHSYLAPKLFEASRTEFVEQMHRELEIMKSDLSRHLIAGDFSALFLSLDYQQELHQGLWFHLSLFDDEQTKIYPLFAQNGSHDYHDSHEYHIAIEFPLIHEQNQLGKIKLHINWKARYEETQTWIMELELTLLFSLLFMLFLNWIIQNKYIHRPLLLLNRATKKLAKGDFEIKLPLVSDDEIGQLTSSFDTMRFDLKASYQSIEKKNQQLLELDRKKDEFIAKISHELNTPLNGILGLSNALMDRQYGQLNNNLQVPIETINNSANRLHSLVKQLTLFKQQEPQSNRIDNVAISAFIKELFTSFHTQLVKKQLNSYYTIDIDLALKSDHDQLIKIFMPLFDNAIKFTHRGEINLIARAVGKSGIAITLIDTGIGIAADKKDKIFESFEQGFDYENRAYEGAGIGLALVKQSVEQLHGLIFLDSTVGEGSSFTIILPTEPAITARQLSDNWEAQQVTASRQGGVEKASKITFTHFKASDQNAVIKENSIEHSIEQQAIQKSIADVSSEHEALQTILLVDDDRANRMVARRFLRNEYRIIEAEDGQQCLSMLADEKLASEKINLVLLDLMMPIVSGFDVLEQIKLHPDKKYPPILVISALIDSKTISQVLELGAVDYITKPFNHAELRARVKTHIELSEREIQLENRVLERTNSLQEAKQRLEETFKQLLQSEKMASIGQLSAGVAHEINNPIGFISSNLVTLNDYIDNMIDLLTKYQALEVACNDSNSEQKTELLKQILDQRVADDLEFILEDIPSLMTDTREGTERVKSIVKSMKAFTHADDGEMTKNNINEAIEMTLKVLRNELKYKCELHKSLAILPEVNCNINQLNQVFTNLLINAAQAIEEHGVISINTWQDDDEIVLEFSDNGKGIKPEHIKHLFDPFFTTKPVGQGTGLGLYLSYEIIQKHKGNIDVESEAGKGTKFIIRLPVS